MRCPECGHLNPVGDVTRHLYEAAERARSADLARLAVGPSLCALAIGAGLCFCVLFAAEPDFFRPIRRPPMTTCLAIWVVSAALYAFRSWRRQGWLAAFLRYEVYAVIAVLRNAVSIFGLWIGACCVSGAFLLPVCSLVAAPLIGLGLVVALRPMRWFDRQARLQLQPLLPSQDPTGQA